MLSAWASPISRAEEDNKEVAVARQSAAPAPAASSDDDDDEEDDDDDDDVDDLAPDLGKHFKSLSLFWCSSSKSSQVFLSNIRGCKFEMAF